MHGHEREVAVRLDSVEVAVVESGSPGDNRERFAVVIVHAENGQWGHAEAAAAPEAVRSYLFARHQDDWDSGPLDVLREMDAHDPAATWTSLQAHTFWSARSGLGYVALAALDTALWDLAGRLNDQPTWRLAVGDGEPKAIDAYATLYHGAADLDTTVAFIRRDAERATSMGFRAVKVEAMPENSSSASDIAVLVRAAREAVGPHVDLMLDVGYRWTSHIEALRVLELVADCNLRFLEAPFQPSHTQEYAQLVDRSAVQIASGDMLTAPSDFMGLLEAGVPIVQAGVARTGYSGLLQLSATAMSFGAQLVPWGFAGTTVAAAGNLHASIASGAVALIECAPPALYPGQTMRRELGQPEPSLDAHGRLVPPDLPGMGVTLNRSALNRFPTELRGIV